MAFGLSAIKDAFTEAARTITSGIKNTTAIAAAAAASIVAAPQSEAQGAIAIPESFTQAQEANPDLYIFTIDGEIQSFERRFAGSYPSLVGVLSEGDTWSAHLLVNPEAPLLTDAFGIKTFGAVDDAVMIFETADNIQISWGSERVGNIGVNSSAIAALNGQIVAADRIDIEVDVTSQDGHGTAELDLAFLTQQSDSLPADNNLIAALPAFAAYAENGWYPGGGLEFGGGVFDDIDLTISDFQGFDGHGTDSVPEPSSAVLILGSAALVAAVGTRRRKPAKRADEAPSLDRAA